MPSAVFFALSKRRRNSVVIICACFVLNVFLGLMLPKFPSYHSFAAVSDARILQHIWQPPPLITLSNSSEKNQQQQHQQQQRPIMYTFFTTLTHRKHTGQDPAGMSMEAHIRMLSTWSQSWWQAGWYPVILTMEDARKHENFEPMNKIIETFKMNSYNQACFHRWIAMGAVGGGWMSDYDVLPLHNFTKEGLELPKNGALTVHDGYHVPSLVSGNSSEWNRLIQRMIDHASATKTTVYLKRSNKNVVTRTPSDMQALVELRAAEPTIFEAEATVAGIQALTTPTSPSEWNTTNFCSVWTPPTVRAIHFAHSHLLEGYLKLHLDQSMEDRPEIAKNWLDQWKSSCPQEDWQEPPSSQQETPIAATLA